VAPFARAVRTSRWQTCDVTDRETESLVLCCMLWARDGQKDAMAEYEDAVLALLVDHDGEVVQRALSDGAAGGPHEVQLLRFADQLAVDRYLADPRRTALAGERHRVIARTELFPVALA
jgi:hypothetical protein